MKKYWKIVLVGIIMTLTIIYVVRHNSVRLVVSEKLVSTTPDLQFELWMDNSDDHPKSKVPYTRSFVGDRIVMTMSHTVSNGHIENMLSWDTTGSGPWKSQFIPTKGDGGRRVNGTTFVSKNSDGTFDITFNDSKGNVYGKGKIIPIS